MVGLVVIGCMPPDEVGVTSCSVGWGDFSGGPDFWLPGFSPEVGWASMVGVEEGVEEGVEDGAG